jgi:nucleoside phosphorylase
LQAEEKIQEETMDRDHPVCDICVVCALSEEAEVFIQETSRLCHVTFQRTFGTLTRREYRYATIQNREGEPLTIYLTWLPRYGPEEMALHFKPVLAELQPRFAAMTGICAGDKERVACGDLIIAERAFLCDTGKIVRGKRGRKQQLYDTSTYHPHPDILQFVQMFDSGQAEVAGLRRPLTRRQQRAWLLTTLLQEPARRITDLPQHELEQHVPDLAQILSELQCGPHPIVTPEGMLQNVARAQEVLSHQDVPSKDRTVPQCHIAALASGSAVRSDSPFQQIHVPVRGALAIDMEGATFYRIVAEFAGLRALLVKGVCDYADPDKDDTYHDYAAAASALYLLCFIKDYVTLALMARPAYHLAASDSGVRDLQPRSKDRPPSHALAGDLHRTDICKLEKAQREQLHRALLQAFPARSELQQMVDFGLDQNLDHIASTANQSQTVFELVKWAETHSQERELILAASRANPDNRELQAFVSDIEWLRDRDS